MAAPTESLDFRDFDDFYAWLREHHAAEKRAVLNIYKKGFHDRGLSYEDAVRAALCWGWIDSTTWRRDEATFLQQFTPRKPRSYWAASNIRRMQAMIDAGRMTDAGLAVFDRTLLDRVEEVQAAERARNEERKELPEAARALLASDPEAAALFEQQAPSYRRQYTLWICHAKKEQTRLRRTRKMMQMLLEGRKPSEI